MREWPGLARATMQGLSGRASRGQQTRGSALATIAAGGVHGEMQRLASVAFPSHLTVTLARQALELCSWWLACVD